MPTKLEQGLAERKRLCRSQDDASWERMDATVSEVNFMPLDFGVREPWILGFDQADFSWTSIHSKSS